MTTRAFNFLWLGLDLPAKPDPANGRIREPIPAEYIKNIRAAGKRHPAAEINLWVDSKRLTKKQQAYITDKIESGMKNVHLKDLRSIPAYDTNDLYNEAETSDYWRHGGDKNSTIWLQVDCAKILICLQGKYDQVFFADLDHAHLNITSRKVQNMLKSSGLMIGSFSSCDLAIENQLWGFTQSRRKFFKEYYEGALQCASARQNAWDELRDRVNNLTCEEDLELENICLPIDSDGSEAEHPGHVNREGDGIRSKPHMLTFKQASAKKTDAEKTKKVQSKKAKPS